MRVVWRVYGFVLGLCGLTAAVIFAAMAVMVTADVLLRNLRIYNMPWLIEVAEYGLYTATFIAAPWILRMGGHVRVDVLVSALPRAWARWIDVGVDALGLVISLVLFWFGTTAAADAHAIGSIIIKELVLPEWWLLSVIPFSTALLAIEFGRRLAAFGGFEADAADEFRRERF